MGIYYKFVNLGTKERIEPTFVGGGGVKSGAIILGDAARLFTFLHVYVHHGWRIYSDASCDGPYMDSEDRGSADYCADMTEHYVGEFNRMNTPHVIAYLAD